MRIRGITYDTGFISAGTTTREPFDPEVVQREMDIIRDDLHCNAVRVTGGHPDRLEIAVRAAASIGLEVWFSPFTNDLTHGETLDLLADCAERAERVRQTGAEVVLVTGAELSIANLGFVPGATFMERVQRLLHAGPGLRETIIEARRGMRDFLPRAAAAARDRFGGRITYASIPFEDVDWSLFDFVALDCYRTAETAAQFRAGIRSLVAQGKPVAITECGCVTFRGAGAKGARGGLIVEYDGARAVRLDGEYVRDEEEQAREIVDVLNIFREEGVDSVFVNTFASYFLPHRENPREDLDMASAGIVKVLERRHGAAYPDMPWEPKAAFHAVAESYRALARSAE